MTAMGEHPAENWSDELRSTGRVVFPLRREPALRQIRATGVLLALLLVFQLPGAMRNGGALRIVAIVVTAAVVISLCVSVWQLFTRKPALMIDGAGVRRGRGRFMAWSEVGAVGELGGPAGERSFVLVSNMRRRKLRVGERHVGDVVALRDWLIELLEERVR